MHCFSVVPFLTNLESFTKPQFYTLVAFDNAAVTTYNFVTDKDDTIDHIRQMLPAYGMSEFKNKWTRMSGAITMCDLEAKNASDLLSVFRRAVKPEIVDKASRINYKDNICLQEITSSHTEEDSVYKLSSMGEIGKFCSPQIISKLVGHELIVFEGQFACLRTADTNVRMKNIGVQYRVNADQPLPNCTFDEVLMPFSWLLGKDGVNGKLVLKYIDKRPVLVHYPKDLKNTHVIGGIQPNLSPVETIYKSILARNFPPALPLHPLKDPSQDPSYSVCNKKP
ncbi:hypothetical protein GcM1_117007 [Golovinomyces cichoracearum]|uniref:Uncharacterized protein n=1 Tax=Golovinomyces cichoracearum TaxID=62708 RepID=A0A420JBZ8_9PEZI|nr:hypothetical protein GcM1_117007 [Golovinomyces cichoracearum]